MAAARTLPHDRPFQAILDGGEHGVMLVVGRDAPRDLMVATGTRMRPTWMTPNEPHITPELVAEHGLKPDEYDRILKLIGRAPSFTELGIFSAMWNEHCSYKSSKVHLRTLPTTGACVIQGPGENAGVIDIGDGLACIF
ncbi:MAG TPA: hypothetical protein VNH21_08145, partial [Steroidobacteraceae bacterium]|nr:hypothetical protein [Steroidobacteraceae bacterium]